MKHRFFAVIAVLTILAFSAVPAAASTPDQVTIISHMTISTSTGTFDASGPAVDAGLICAQGDVYDELRLVTAYQGPVLVNLYIHKLFVCGDGSGSFGMDLKVHVFNDPYLAVTQWVVTDGDGDYARLRGTGGISATKLDDDHLIDTYWGRLHID